MQQITQLAAAGWKVVGPDDKEIGQVSGLGEGYFVMSKGLIFSKSLYVPNQYIDHADPAGERVHLRIGKDVVDTMGWDTPPGIGDDPTAGVDPGVGTSDDSWRMPR